MPAAEVYKGWRDTICGNRIARDGFDGLGGVVGFP
jgi:hypothetical protein